MQISAVIITKNEAENIERCLKSIRPVVSEIIVVDAFSEDSTVEICEHLGAKVIQKKWIGYSQNKNFGHSQCKHDWILSIDADEELSSELTHTLQQIQPQTNTAYKINRLTNFAGQWVKHSGWHPDWNIRLFNRQEVYWKGDYVHETLFVPTHFKIIPIDGLLFHYSYKNAADHWQRIERYAQLAAAEMYASGKKAKWWKMWLSPVARFIKTYVIKKGFLDGLLGWQIAYRDTYLVHRKYQLLKEKWSS